MFFLYSDFDDNQMQFCDCAIRWYIAAVCDVLQFVLY